MSDRVGDPVERSRSRYDYPWFNRNDELATTNGSDTTSCCSELAGDLNIEDLNEEDDTITVCEELQGVLRFTEQVGGIAAILSCT